LEKRRREMVALARRGYAIREIAHKFRVSRPTVELKEQAASDSIGLPLLTCRARRTQ